MDECWMNGVGSKFPLELTSDTFITLIKLWSILKGRFTLVTKGCEKK